MRRYRLLAPLVGLLAAGPGCSESVGWRPPAPEGVTYVYDHQGFRQQERGGFGGVARIAPGVGVAYGGAFNFRQGSELNGSMDKDPFAETTPIDGVHFNQHLGPRGAPVAPAPLAAPPAPPSSSAPRPPGAP